MGRQRSKAYLGKRAAHGTNGIRSQNYVHGMVSALMLLLLALGLALSPVLEVSESGTIAGVAGVEQDCFTSSTRSEKTMVRLFSYLVHTTSLKTKHANRSPSIWGRSFSQFKVSSCFVQAERMRSLSVKAYPNTHLQNASTQYHFHGLRTEKILCIGATRICSRRAL